MHLIDKVKGFLTLFREGQIDKHTAVVFSLQLILCKIHLFICVIQSLLQVVVQRYIAVLNLIVNKHKHVDQRYTVAGQSVYYLGIVLIVDRIRRVDKFCHLIVQIDQL